MALIPFHDREGWIWFDGEFVPWREANVHVLTHALHYGSSVFEGARMYGGEIFKLTEHSERLVKSAEILDFQIPYSVAEIDEACKATAAKNGLTDCYVRPLAWRGSETVSVAAPNNRIHAMVAVWEWPSYFDPEAKKRGIRVANAVYRRPDPASAPVHAKAAGLYMICTISKHVAERAGYQDAMMLDHEGYVAELTGANLFFVQDGAIHTPLADRFLDGITRRTVIDLAKARGHEVIERRIRPDELPTFSECFITGTAVEVTAVGEIAEHRFTPGEVTFTLADDYSRLVRRQG